MMSIVTDSKGRGGTALATTPISTDFTSSRSSPHTSNDHPLEQIL